MKGTVRGISDTFIQSLVSFGALTQEQQMDVMERIKEQASDHFQDFVCVFIRKGESMSGQKVKQDQNKSKSADSASDFYERFPRENWATRYFDNLDKEFVEGIYAESEEGSSRHKK